LIDTGYFDCKALNHASRSYVDICEKSSADVCQELLKWGSIPVNPISGKKQCPQNARRTVEQRRFLPSTKYNNAHATEPRRQRALKGAAEARHKGKGEGKGKGKGKGASGNDQGKR